MACLHCGTRRPVAHRLSSYHGQNSSCALPKTLSSMCASDYIHYQSSALKEQGNGVSFFLQLTSTLLSLLLGFVIVPQIYYTHGADTVRVRTI